MAAKQRVLITGAGSGLGRAIALEFARRGAQVACTDLKPQSAEQTLADIKAAGGAGMCFALDVTSEAQFDSAVAQLEMSWGGLDVLLNNAGVASSGTVADSPLEQWRWVIDINLMGCVRGARAAIPLMQRQRSGHIVNISSFAGIANPPALASYSVTKAAVISLSETLRLELADEGIGVSVACPSFFETGLVENSQSAGPDSGNSAPQVLAIAKHLMQTSRITADDVARDICNAVEKKRFMVISHADARTRYRIKRASPEAFFKLARKATAPFLKKR